MSQNKIENLSLKNFQAPISLISSAFTLNTANLIISDYPNPLQMPGDDKSDFCGCLNL